ncbi:MAG: SAM-dependent methyltransferase [Pseudomonadota bacterium]
MTLRNRLISQIRMHGPISVADYMQIALMDPKEGYYPTRDPLGAAGDFTTAPEISQMFGELIGLCLAQSWLDRGAPAPFTLAELGPGRGTLMADLLRATRVVPGFHAAAQIHLVEVSPALRIKQAETLEDEDPVWLDRVTALPAQPLFLIANEFLDALPIRQFLRDDAHWRERQIGLSEDALAFGLGPVQPQPALSFRLEDTQVGDLVEDCPGLAPIIAEVSARIRDHGGVGLFVDYGDWRSLGDTLQALHDHKPADPLAAPGAADLTAHVDFEAVAKAALCPHSRLTPQGVFLERLGIVDRAQRLAEDLKAGVLDAHVAAFRRLTHPDEMGNLFKVMALYSEDAAPPPGLEP